MKYCKFCKVNRYRVLMGVLCGDIFVKVINER